MTTLTGRFTRSERRATSRTAAPAITGDVASVASVSVVAGTRSSCCFAACIAARHRCTRSTGSSQSVGSSATIDDTRFVHGSSSMPVRIETGTIARSGSAGSASWRSRYSRSAPAHTAITTSLTVPPVASLSALMFDSAVVRIANRRCGPTLLFQGVGGAGVIGIATLRSCSATASASSPRPTVVAIRSRERPTTPLRLLSPAASAKFRTILSDRRVALTGFATRLLIVCLRSSPSVGSGSPRHDTGFHGHSASRDSSVNSLSMITPAAPSTVA